MWIMKRGKCGLEEEKIKDKETMPVWIRRKDGYGLGTETRVN